jgi:hypothetical protein
MRNACRSNPAPSFSTASAVVRGELNLIAQRREFRNLIGAGKFSQKMYDEETTVGRGIERDGRGLEQARA